MNAVFFAMKRAYWSTLREGRDRLRGLGLTAARFDLLYALTDEGVPKPRGMYQSALRRVLGVTRPTVSVMLRSLEKLGLVSRTRSEIDRRQIDIALTRRGRKLFVFAYKTLIVSGWSQVTLDHALNGRFVSYLDPGMEMRCIAKMEHCEALLGRFRRIYSDFATLKYFWHPLFD